MRAFVAVLLLTVGVQVGAAQQSQCTDQDLSVAPTLAVQSVSVEGGQEAVEAAVAEAKRAFQKPVYRRCELKDALAEAAERVRRVYQERGYFKAAVEDPLTRPAGGERVDVVISVDLGSLYRLRDITFTHVTAFAAEQLRPLFGLQSGDIFNAATFSKGLERLRQLYVAKGYINSAPVPTPEFDDQARTVGWTIDMDEGPVFTIGPLVLDGVEPARGVGKRLLADWQRLIGQAYDPEVTRRFLVDHAALLGMRNPDPQQLFQTLLDVEAHVVTFKLNFPD